MRSSFSFKRVLFMLGVILSLVSFTFASAFFWLPGADVVIIKQTSDLLKYLAGDIEEDISDEDGLNKKLKGPQIKAIEGLTPSAPAVTFYFAGEEYRIKPVVDSAAYNGAVEADRLVYRVSTVSDELVVADYYRSYVDESAQQETLDSVASQLRQIKEEENLDSDSYVELIVKYVQSIPYDNSRAAIISNPKAKPGKGDPRFPIQVLGDGQGDCDEKVFLLAALLGAEGYGTSALLFEDERHMSLGIRSQGVGFKNTGYEYIEATAISYVSELPTRMVNDIVIESDPKVIKLTNGNGYYTERAVLEVQHIMSSRTRAEKTVADLKQKMDASRNNPREYNKYVDQYNTAVEAHNTLNNIAGDDSGNSYRSQFKDRAAAIKWLARHSF